MSDYFTHLAARALGVAETARPRRSIFEPRRGAVEPAALEPEAPRVGAKVPPEASEREIPPAASPSEAVEPAVPPREEQPRPVAGRAPSRVARPRRLPGPAARLAQRAFPPSHGESPPAAEEPEPVPTAPPIPVRRANAVVSSRMRAPKPEIPAVPVTLRPPRLFVQRAEAPAPTVRVTIGRVEVRAETTEQPRPKKRQEPKRQPRMSLDEFLGRRQ